MAPRKRSVSDLACVIIDNGRIQLLDCIGRGSFGAVYRARDLTGQISSLLAVKIIPKDSKLEYHWREVTTLRRAQHHPNIVKMHRWFHDQSCIYIVLDYCPGGDMWRAIKERKVFAGNDVLVKKVFLQVIDGLKWCHSRGVYHRDLKPNNILISQDCMTVWLTDFGLATATRKSFNFHTGTQQYRSPGGICYIVDDYFRMNTYSHSECNNISGEHHPFDAVRNDIWSLGIILVNMLTGVMPWAIANREDGWYMTYARDHQFLRYTLPISKETDYILQRIFTENSEEAIGVDELRILVEDVRNFWMEEGEIAEGEPHLQRVANNYRRDEPVDMPALNSWDFDSPYDSLLDDSDDSDEHSIGLHSPSLRALEEGRPRSPTSISLDEREEVEGYIPEELCNRRTAIHIHTSEPNKNVNSDSPASIFPEQFPPALRRPGLLSSSATSTTRNSSDNPGDSGYEDVSRKVGRKESRWSLRRHFRRLFPIRN